MISSVDITRYGVSRAKDLNIRGFRYNCKNGGKINGSLPIHLKIS